MNRITFILILLVALDFQSFAATRSNKNSIKVISSTKLNISSKANIDWTSPGLVEGYHFSKKLNFDDLRYISKCLENIRRNEFESKQEFEDRTKFITTTWFAFAYPIRRKTQHNMDGRGPQWETYNSDDQSFQFSDDVVGSTDTIELFGSRKPFGHYIGTNGYGANVTITKIRGILEEIQLSGRVDGSTDPVINIKMHMPPQQAKSASGHFMVVFALKPVLSTEFRSDYENQNSGVHNERIGPTFENPNDGYITTYLIVADTVRVFIIDTQTNTVVGTTTLNRP